MQCHRGICDVFPVDLGIDLRALVPEITQCKRKYQRELWSIICGSVLNNAAAAGEETKEDEAPKEEEEEEENNESNAAASWNNWIGGGGGWQIRQGTQHRQQQRRQPQLQLQQLQKPPHQDWRNRNPAGRQTGGHQWTGAPQPARNPPRQHQQHHQERRQHQQHPRQHSRQARDDAREGGKLMNSQQRSRPVDGIVDWRDDGGFCTRLAPDRQQQQQHQQDGEYGRIYRGLPVATNATEDEQLVNASEGFEPARIFGSGGDNSGCSDSDSDTYCRVFDNRDEATMSTDASRAFVPLVTGNWCASGHRLRLH